MLLFSEIKKKSNKLYYESAITNYLFNMTNTETPRTLIEKLFDIPWYEGGYAVTQSWRVWSHPKKNWPNVSGRFLIPRNDTDGYPYVNLYNPKRKTWKVHKLISITFIKNIKNDLQINHKNGIKTDNRVENLEWCDSSYNQKHCCDVLGKRLKKIWKYDEMWGLVREYRSLKEATKDMWLNWSSYLRRCLKENTLWYGYYWKYITN